MDPYQFLHISRNADGSLTRSNVLPNSSPTGDQPLHSVPVISKDVPLNPAHNTWLRVFLPTRSSNKLPVVFFFHGGGFILFSAATTPFHDFCAKLSVDLPAIVLSVDYRLAPEHRLPAPYDDAMDALLWARSAVDPWLTAHADLSRCFLMGSSSGGNIAYHAGLRAMAMDLSPLRIQGLILNQPFFGGKERTESETRMAADRIIPLPANDLMWELALPEGEDRDHEYCNPAKVAVAVAGLPRCLVSGYVGDPLVDRQRLFAKMLERGRVSAVAHLEEEGHHGIELFKPEKAEALVADVKKFVYCYAAVPAGGSAVTGHRL